MASRDRLPRFLLPWAGFAAGCGWAGGAAAVGRLFGTESAAVLTTAVVAAAAFVVGLCRESFGAADGARPATVRVGHRFVVLGILLAAAAFAGNAGRALAWAGAGADAGDVALALARGVFAAILLGPAALAAGSALRLIGRLLPDGPDAGVSLQAGAVAAGLAIVLVTVLQLALTRDPSRLAAGAGGLLLLGAAIPLLRASGGREPEAESTPLDVPAGAAGLALGFGLASLAFLGARIFVPVFADELPGVPVALAVLVVSGVLGAVIAAVLSARNVIPQPAVGAGLAGLAALVAMARLADWGTLPTPFVAAVEAAPDFDAVLRAALGLLLPRLAPAGLLLGAGAAWMVTTVPGERSRRSGWFVAAGAGLVVGAVAGAACARVSVAPFGLAHAMLGTFALGAALSAVAAARASGPPALRGAVVLALVAGAGLCARWAPSVNRMELLVDRNLVSVSALSRKTPESWLASDQEDDVMGAAILRRGHARRLLVNGRFDSSNETTARTHGMLAHLPLLFHPDAKRVLLLGAGTGGALAAATAHPVQRVDVFDVSRVPVRAAVRMGPVSYGAFADGRVRLHTGDLDDLLARSGRYDVILVEPSGGWTQRSIATCTREFLTRVRDHLEESGIASAWIPGAALTREGFLVAVATWADVFPQVEAWAGRGGDVLLVAQQLRTRHDFSRLLDAYREPQVGAACEAAWIATPETLLSQFLVGDTTLRRLTGATAVSTRDNGALARHEAERRRGAPTVDPVPGLSDIRDDVVSEFVNTPPEGFAEAISRAVQARDLERKGLDLELAAKQEEAGRTYEEALELNPHDGSLRRALATLRSEQGIAYQAKDSFFAAHQHMRSAVETDSTYAQGFANLGLLLLLNDKFDYALACTGQATELAPDDDLFALQMGRIWKKRGYFDKALPYYERARELNPQNIEAAIGWLDTKLAMQGDHADLKWGLGFLKSLLPLNPDHADLKFRIERLELAIQRHETSPPGDTSSPAAPDSAAPAGASAP